MPHATAEAIAPNPCDRQIFTITADDLTEGDKIRYLGSTRSLSPALTQLRGGLS